MTDSPLAPEVTDWLRRVLAPATVRINRYDAEAKPMVAVVVSYGEGEARIRHAAMGLRMLSVTGQRVFAQRAATILRGWLQSQGVALDMPEAKPLDAS